MDNIKDELLADAIKTSLDYSYTIKKQKIAIYIMSAVIIILLAVIIYG